MILFRVNGYVGPWIAYVTTLHEYMDTFWSLNKQRKTLLDVNWFSNTASDHFLFVWQAGTNECICISVSMATQGDQCFLMCFCCCFFFSTGSFQLLSWWKLSSTNKKRTQCNRPMRQWTPWSFGLISDHLRSQGNKRNRLNLTWSL